MNEHLAFPKGEAEPLQLVRCSGFTLLCIKANSGYPLLVATNGVHLEPAGHWFGADQQDDPEGLYFLIKLGSWEDR
jgi:hypothetical protein